MACNETNNCTDPCNQYDNCGCVVETTFGCVKTNKSRPCIGTLSGQDGEYILDLIEEKVCDIGKVKLDEDDTCPEGLIEKLEAGLNISITPTGTGCSRRLRIDAVDGGTPIDINAKVSINDTTSGYLNSKINGGDHISKNILNPSGNEVLELDVNVPSLVSTDSGNQIVLGTDGLLKTSYSAPDGSETKVIAGVGTTVSGTGTISDPYIVSTNPSIQVVRPCFDNIWRNVTLSASGNPNVIYASGNPQYRYRFDGTIEFRGSITYTVNFGTYQSSNRKFTIPVGTIPTTCLTLGELAGTKDLKSINYIDIPQVGADQYTQMYGYIIRSASQNIILEFQSSFINATSKSIVVNFEGAVIHPSI